MKPFFSIVIPTWNSGALLDETMRSLLNQDFPAEEYEIIAVDDGSTDGTVGRLQGFGSRVQVLSQANSGAPTARNAGIHQAIGEYLVNFDHDDILLPWALKVYRTVIEAYGRPPVVIAQQVWFRSDAARGDERAQPSAIRCVKSVDFLRKSVATSTTNSTLVLRKDVVVQAGGFARDSAAFDDDDLLLRLGVDGPMIKIMEPVTVGHRMHAANARHNLPFLSRGALMLVRNERRSVYPGGWRRWLDRRGLVGSRVASTIYHYHLRARTVPWPKRLGQISTLLLHARGMILAAVLRKIRSRLYPREERSFPLSG